jgi:hypothetical protein
LRIIDFDDYVSHELARVSYTPQRIWLRRIALGLVVLGGIVFLSALVIGRFEWLALLFVVAASLSTVALGYYEWSYRRHSSLRSQLRAGLRGQRLLPQVLASLDDSYYLLNNLQLPARADDLDHILVGPNGVFALETKNHRGRIHWRDGQWYQSKVSRRGHLQPETPIRDPSQQLKRNVDYLRSCINRTDLALSQRTRLWIEGAVVFSHPAVSLDLPPAVLGTLPFPVLQGRDLPAHIAEHVPRRRFSQTEVRQIVSMLAHLQPADPVRAPYKGRPKRRG